MTGPPTIVFGQQPLTMVAGQLPVSRLTGHVDPSTHFSGKRVSRALRTIGLALFAVATTPPELESMLSALRPQPYSLNGDENEILSPGSVLHASHSDARSSRVHPVWLRGSAE